LAFTNLTSRTDAAALVPEEVSNEMLGKATEQSAVLARFRRVPVGRNQVRFPVLSALPIAYFVGGDTGLKQTTEVNWANKFLNVEEIATIMPVPDNVLADVDANIWDEAMPLLTEAFGRTLDQAVFFGTNAPSSWPDEHPHRPHQRREHRHRGLRSHGRRLLRRHRRPLRQGRGRRLRGQRLGRRRLRQVEAPHRPRLAGPQARRRPHRRRHRHPRRLPHLLPDARPLAHHVGSAAPLRRRLGPVRHRRPPGHHHEGPDGSGHPGQHGAIVYNLAQQDMTAVRLTFRIGWQVANTINNDQPTESARYPVGALLIP
jgi:hypothetical protein